MRYVRCPNSGLSIGISFKLLTTSFFTGTCFFGGAFLYSTSYCSSSSSSIIIILTFFCGTFTTIGLSSTTFAGFVLFCFLIGSGSISSITPSGSGSGNGAGATLGFLSNFFGGSIGSFTLRTGSGSGSGSSSLIITSSSFALNMISSLIFFVFFPF